MVVVLLPFVGTVVGVAVLWDALDRGFMGRPLDGILMTSATKFNDLTHDFNKKFVKNSEDSYMVNTVILLGVVVPSCWLYCLYSTVTHGFSPLLCFPYWPILHELRLRVHALPQRGTYTPRPLATAIQVSE